MASQSFLRSALQRSARQAFGLRPGAPLASVVSSASPAGRTFSSTGIALDGDSANEAKTRTTHFGFQTVREEEKADMVGSVFRRVAENYDVMNDFMSAGTHRLWKDQFVNMTGPLRSYAATSGQQPQRPPLALLDVAGGTGDIAFRLFEKLRRSSPPLPPALTAEDDAKQGRPAITVFDINDAMLQVGKERAVNLGYLPADGAPVDPAPTSNPRLVFTQGDAQYLPFASASQDLYTIAFGIRNVTNVQLALQEAYRVLRPGGRFMCLEFSRVTNPLLAPLYEWYSFAVIPVLGEAVAKDRAAYQYLVESIRKFPEQDSFARMITKAGFKHVSYTNLTFGVCAIHTGFKL